MKFKKLMALGMAMTIAFTSLTVYNVGFADEVLVNETYNSVQLVKAEFTNKYPDDIELIEEVINIAMCDSIFIETYEYDNELAIEILENTLINSINQKYQISTHASGDNGIYYSLVDVPVVKQATDWYCCPASVIEAFIGNAVFTDTERNKSSEMQNSIATELGVSQENGAPIPAKVASVLNKRLSGNPYGIGYFTYLSYDSAIDYAKSALQNYYVPLVRIADTSTLGYYGTKPLTHYVAISKIDCNRKKITIVDPNNDSRFGGEHEITFDEFINAMKKDYNGDNCWIIAYGNGINTL